MKYLTVAFCDGVSCAPISGSFSRNLVERIFFSHAGVEPNHAADAGDQSDHADACPEDRVARRNVADKPVTIRPGVTIMMAVDPDGNWVEFLQND